MRTERTNAAEEADLVGRCAKGDGRAREELCCACWPVAARLARHIAGDAGESEDLAQEALCRLLGHLPKLHGEASLATWLYRTLTNLQRDRLRRRAKSRECSLEFLQGGATVELEYGMALIAPDPAEIVEGRFWRRRLVQAAKELSRRDRKVLWLHFRREYSHAQIAARLDCTVNAVKCRLYRVTSHLRRELAFDP